MRPHQPELLAGRRQAGPWQDGAAVLRQGWLYTRMHTCTLADTTLSSAVPSHVLISTGHAMGGCSGPNGNRGCPAALPCRRWSGTPPPRPRNVAPSTLPRVQPCPCLRVAKVCSSACPAAISAPQNVVLLQATPVVRKCQLKYRLERGSVCRFACCTVYCSRISGRCWCRREAGGGGAEVRARGAAAGAPGQPAHHAAAAVARGCADCRRMSPLACLIGASSSIKCTHCTDCCSDTCRRALAGSDGEREAELQAAEAARWAQHCLAAPCCTLAYRSPPAPRCHGVLFIKQLARRVCSCWQAAEAAVC